MVEIGRFRHGRETFFGRVIDGTVIEQADGWAFPESSGGHRWDYGDLVVLSPTEPAAIVEVTVTADGRRQRSLPCASLGPHRGMVAVPRGLITVTASPRIGYIILNGEDPLGKSRPTVPTMGCVSAIVFREARGDGRDTASSPGATPEGYTTLGPTVALGGDALVLQPTLWHNGREIPVEKPSILPMPPDAPLAEISSRMRLGRGDLILLGAEGGSVVVRPGDHLECRCPPFRSAAVNIGLRGSA